VQGVVLPQGHGGTVKKGKEKMKKSVRNLFVSVILMLCFTLFSCKKSTPSLTTLFWNPPVTRDAVVKLGAEKCTTPEQDFYSFKKQDSDLQFFYNDEKLLLVVLSFKTAGDSEHKLDSIAREHHLTVKDPPVFTSDEFNVEFNVDSVSYCHFFVTDSSLSLRRYFFERK
jgi:hypothetical protein